MPNSLNRLFRRLREHAQQRKKSHDNQQQPIQNAPATAAEVPLMNNNNVSSLSSTSGGGIVGCCSRKTSSTLSKDHHLMASHHFHFPSRKASSSSAKYCCPPVEEEPKLPDPLLHRIFDSIENPFELVRLRRVGKAAAEYVQSKICRISEMDLRRVGFETLSSASSTSGASSGQPDTSVIVEGEIWHVHPSGCKVLCRVTPIGPEDQRCLIQQSTEKNSSKNATEEKTSQGALRLEVLVDDQWTSREIVVLCSLVNEFRRFVHRISLDAPIFELIVANLASVDLDRWFAFQCFVKAVDECQMDAALNKLAAQLQQQQQQEELDEGDPEHLYWPNAKTILIRTTERESVHLARVLNYGVRSCLVMDRRRLDRLSLQVCVTDANKAATRPKQLVRNLYHFRCWAGSLGFDERFTQNWRVSGTVA